jgi:hypothetical protein
MTKIMRSEYQASEQEALHRKEKHPYSEEYWLIDTATPNPELAPDIAPRSSAYRSAGAAVRSGYPRSHQGRVPRFDITRLPTLPQKSYTNPDTTGLAGSRVSQPKTDDLTEQIFQNIEGLLSIDEIGTFPPDVQARLHAGLKKAVSYDTSMHSDRYTSPVSSLKRKQEEASQEFENGQRVTTPLPDNIEQIVQLSGFSIEDWWDSVRWWLLSPGRLEFVLWLIGAIILVFLTSIFLLVVVLSLGHFGTGI